MKIHNIQEYRRRLVSPNYSREQVVANVLKKCTYKEILWYYENTPVTFKGLFRYRISHLKRKSYSDIYSTGGVFLRQPIDYVGLMAYVLPTFKDEINRYVIIKEEFERYYLSGEYDKCKQLLSTANNTISYSAWSAVNYIKIAELSGGLDARITEFNRICEEHLSPMMEHICRVAQRTASVEVSVSSLTEKHYAEEISVFSGKEWQKNFITSTCYPYYPYQIGEWMSYDMMSSIIDLYNSFIFNLSHLLTAFRDSDEFKKYMGIITASIDDVRLSKYSVLLNLEKPYDNGDRCEITYQLYHECNESQLQKVEEYIYDHPYDIDTIYLYNRHLVDYHIPRRKGRADGNLLERINYLLYDYLNNCNDILSFNKLITITQSNPGFQCFRQLYYILADLRNNVVTDTANSYWKHSYGQNLLDIKYFSNQLEKETYLCINDFFSGDLFDREFGIEQVVMGVDGNNDYLGMIANAINRGNVPPYYRGASVSYLFNKYVECRKYKEAVLLYVNEKLSTPHLLIHIDRQMVTKEFTREIDRSLKIPLELSVFYTMINAGLPKITSNVCKFLSECGVSRPSQLQNDDSPLIMYFLEKVVDLNTLDAIPDDFYEEEEALEERLAICQRLSRKTGKKEYYAFEINRLVKELGIMKFLKEVDSSKIDVDVNLLKAREMEDVKEAYQIYRDSPEQADIYADKLVSNEVFPYDSSDEESVSDKGKHNDRVGVQNKVRYRYVMFHEFYKYVRDKFLINNTAGLDYFLSTRIRHGTIVNQLRHNFQALLLTTKKGIDGGYDLNTYWAMDVFHLEGESCTRCMDIFLQFAKVVDDAITELKDNYIQVKTERHNANLEACFDFNVSYFEDRIVALYNDDDGDYYHCIDTVFSDLWHHTNFCFENVRKEITRTEEILKSALDSLCYQIESLLGHNHIGFAQFRDTITKCHTSLHEDIKAVTRWFQLKQSYGYDFTILQLVDASVEAIQKVNDIEFTVTPQINSISEFRSITLNTFYDLFHNLLNNVVDYYTEKNKPAKCDITIKEGPDFLEIWIENKIDKKDIDKAQRYIDKYIAQKNSLENAAMARMEGRSGLYKTHTIVFHQLATDGNEFTPYIEGDKYVAYIKLNTKNLKVTDENTAH